MFHVINMPENRMTGCFHCQTHTPRTDNVCLRSIPEFHLGMLCSREMACHLRNKSINSRALCPEFDIYPRGQMETAKTTWKDAQPCSNPANRNQNYLRENCPELKKVKVTMWPGNSTWVLDLHPRNGKQVSKQTLVHQCPPWNELHWPESETIHASISG